MNSVLKTTLKLLTVGALWFAVQPSVLAEQNSASTEMTQVDPQLENQRNPNEYCAKCHKFDTSKDQAKGEFHAGKFHGTHLDKLNPSTGKPITCVSCHGHISENHRRGVKDVMRFDPKFWGGHQPMFSIQEQNQVCFSCHQPDKLREKFWAHDVHAMKLGCSSCHTLHPKEDAMKNIPTKQRVKLCVDCHGKQQKSKERREREAANAEMKDNAKKE